MLNGLVPLNYLMIKIIKCDLSLLVMQTLCKKRYIKKLQISNLIKIMDRNLKSY